MHKECCGGEVVADYVHPSNKRGREGSGEYEQQTKQCANQTWSELVQ
jgi:hypothetical protein